MILEISIRRPFSFPRVFGAQNDESRQDYHWIGHGPDLEQESAAPGGQNKNPQSGDRKQKYRPLDDITLGDVEDAYKRFEHQISPAQENWIGKNYFCQIPLKRRRGQPPLVFGRVKTCFPSDGVVDNVEEMELYFPNKGGVPDVLHIHKDEISRNSQRQVQSYFIRVKVLVSEEEKAELTGSDLSLSANGFHPEFESSYLDLLEMNERNHPVYPWMYVIGSRWFEGIPDSLHEEMKGKLKEMIGWGKQVFNYHPQWLTNEVSTLNRALGYKYGFTPVVLTEPADAGEIGMIVAKTFDRMISIPLG